MKKLYSEPIDASQSQQLQSSDHHHNSMEEISGENLGQHQPLTMFYNGKVLVSNVTDLQARTILNLARREMEERPRRSPKASEPPPSSSDWQPPHQAYSPNSTLSMKRSLQRFLQKRKIRIHSTSPYDR